MMRWKNLYRDLAVWQIQIGHANSLIRFQRGTLFHQMAVLKFFLLPTDRLIRRNSELPREGCHVLLQPQE